ncbi:hypothetical protein Y032_0388g501 [Ancylostoma ceylanicum]|uniref:Uncharacterized protein n=1 Tax=Ancylostoma ceylanicum TaxID=53326 RepID=A0A016RS95_9BILA|nr:hypothetical protein Y032_0388g501 [Ancylostoma ceylanicum]
MVSYYEDYGFDFLRLSDGTPLLGMVPINLFVMLDALLPCSLVEFFFAHCFLALFVRSLASVDAADFSLCVFSIANCRTSKIRYFRSIEKAANGLLCYLKLLIVILHNET